MSLARPELDIFPVVAIVTSPIRGWFTIFLMLMEDAMKNPDARSLYVLIASLCATLISLPAVWYFAAAAHAAPGLVA